MKLTIGKGVLSENGFGQVVVDDIPEPLVCPQCGTEASDNGECLVKLELAPNWNPVPQLVERAPLVLALMADCRCCGYYGQGPTNITCSIP